MRTLLCLSFLAIMLVSVFASPVEESSAQAAATLIDVDQPLQGHENVGVREARQFGYGGYRGYRGGYRGGYGGYGGYRGGYGGGFGRYRNGFGGYGGYGGYRGGFYG